MCGPYNWFKIQPQSGNSTRWSRFFYSSFVSKTIYIGTGILSFIVGPSIVFRWVEGPSHVMTSGGADRPEVIGDDPTERLELSRISLFLDYKFDQSWVWRFRSSYTTCRQMGNVSFYRKFHVTI